MRIAIYTLTRDRLRYTQHCFRMLQMKAGYPYDHYVVDNASTDGTLEWLTENSDKFAGIFVNAKNYGNCVGNNQAVSMIGPDNYDLIIRMDNDCEVQTIHLLAAVADFYTTLKKLNQFEVYVTSPKVNGIVNQPARAGEIRVGSYRLGLASIIGGIFRIIPAPILKNYVWPIDMSIVAGEECVAAWHRSRGGQVAYLEDLEVYHYETTGGQEARFPEYHKRKVKEWNDLPDSDFEIPEPAWKE